MLDQKGGRFDRGGRRRLKKVPVAVPVFYNTLKINLVCSPQRNNGKAGTILEYVYVSVLQRIVYIWDNGNTVKVRNGGRCNFSRFFAVLVVGDRWVFGHF